MPTQRLNAEQGNECTAVRETEQRRTVMVVEPARSRGSWKCIERTSVREVKQNRGCIVLVSQRKTKKQQETVL